MTGEEGHSPLDGREIDRPERGLRPGYHRVTCRQKTRPPGQMPGGVVAREVRVVADVVAIDANKRTVRLRGPQRTIDLPVDDPKQLAGIKVGDQVEATFVDAVAVSVEQSRAASR